MPDGGSLARGAHQWCSMRASAEPRRQPQPSAENPAHWSGGRKVANRTERDDCKRLAVRRPGGAGPCAMKNLRELASTAFVIDFDVPEESPH